MFHKKRALKRVAHEEKVNRLVFSHLDHKVVVFHLKRFWHDGRDLWEEIKSGRKKIEYRDATDYWKKRLIQRQPTRAWFVVGFPKGNLPRLEADIVAIREDDDAKQILTFIDDIVTEVGHDGVVYHSLREQPQGGTKNH